MKGRAGRALAYAVFLALCAAGLDLAFGALVPASAQRSFRTAHPYYHHGLRPLQSAHTEWGGRRYDLFTDSLGLRDAAPGETPLRAPGPRVVLLGDSMIEGLGVRFEDTAGGLLAARGRERGVDVRNAASVSYSPKLYALRARWLLEEEGLAFDRLVVFVDVSDVHDEILYEDFVPRRTLGVLAPFVQGWRAHSLVAQLADRFGGGGIDNRFRRDADLHAWMQTVPRYRAATGNPDAGRWEWTYDDAAFAAWGERGLALAGRHLAELAALCRERGIELVIVVYPSPYQIFANEAAGRQVAFWRAFAAREQVGFVDLFPAFVDPLQRSPESTYAQFFLTGDVHWNEAGHALVADRVAEAVLGFPAR